MPPTSIDFCAMTVETLLSLARDILSRVQAQGLPKDYYIKLTYGTDRQGVTMPAWLKKDHPVFMTIVLEHQFEKLQVTPEAFSMELSFDGKPALLTVPLEAVVKFSDPWVSFTVPLVARAASKSTMPAPSTMPDSPVPAALSPPVTAEVVKLDSFRHNK